MTPWKYPTTTRTLPYTPHPTAPTLAALLCGITTLQALALDGVGQEPVRHLGPVDGADLMGGHRSDAILVRLAPGFRLEAGRRGLELVQAQDGDRGVGVSTTLAAWG